MTAPNPVASRSPDRTGVRCPGQGAPSARETTIGQGFPSPYQPDKGRSAIYRTDLGPDSCWYALCAAIVGNRGKPSGESRLSLLAGLSPLPTGDVCPGCRQIGRHGTPQRENCDARRAGHQEKAALTFCYGKLGYHTVEKRWMGHSSEICRLKLQARRGNKCEINSAYQEPSCSRRVP